MSDGDTPANDIQVFDVYGKLVEVMVGTNDYSPLQTVQIDLSRYADGVYFVQAGSGAVTKVVVRR